MYDVIVEIENDWHCAWQEMTKLTWVRSPLKVLITYNWYRGNETIWAAENRILSDSFSKIIKQSNNKFKDNPDTKYHMLVGNNADKKLNWLPFGFDGDGNPGPK